MRIWQLALPVVMLFASVTDAWALEPAKHRSLAEKSCTDAGLPRAFCHRMGKQVYETDYREWTNLAAHAQRDLGQDRCTAADAAQSRVDTLAREVVAKLHAFDYDAAAVALGRAVHTLQDECAHHGMTNEEHAYYSLTQSCTGNSVSPDVQPEALACAETRTREAFRVVASALAGSRWDYVDTICTDSEGRDSCQAAVLPTPTMACGFLALHDDWDGDDSRWNGDVVGPALMAAFANGLQGGPAPQPMCQRDASALDPRAPHAAVTNRAAGCIKINASCLGKVDDSGASDQTSAGGGCDVSSSPGTPSLVVVVVAFVLRRRRRITAS